MMAGFACWGNAAGADMLRFVSDDLPPQGNAIFGIKASLITPAKQLALDSDIRHPACDFTLKAG